MLDQYALNFEEVKTLTLEKLNDEKLQTRVDNLIDWFFIEGNESWEAKKLSSKLKDLLKENEEKNVLSSIVRDKYTLSMELLNFCYVHYLNDREILDLYSTKLKIALEKKYLILNRLKYAILAINYVEKALSITRLITRALDNNKEL